MPGSIEWRSERTCRIIISDGRADGKKRTIRETMTFSNGETKAHMLKLAEVCKAELYVQAKQGERTSGLQHTLKSFAQLWLAEHAPTEGLSPVTVSGYEHLLIGRIYPTIGQIKLHQLTPTHLTRFYRKLLTENGKAKSKSGNKPLSASTVLHYHRVIRAILNTAVRWGVIPNNPALKASIPKNDAKRMKAYDPKQASSMLEALTGELAIFQAGVLLGLLCQMRKGEIVGLDWASIDWDAQTIAIKQSAVYLSGKGTIIKETKTESGKRSLAAPTLVMTALRALKSEQNKQRIALGPDWIDQGAVFTQWNGTRQHPDTISKWFHKFLQRHQLPMIRFHDLRHTGASIMMNIMGEPVQIVADRLGHSTSSITMAFYSHGYASKDRSASDDLNALLTPEKVAK